MRNDPRWSAPYYWAAFELPSAPIRRVHGQIGYQSKMKCELSGCSPFWEDGEAITIFPE